MINKHKFGKTSKKHAAQVKCICIWIFFFKFKNFFFLMYTDDSQCKKKSSDYHNKLTDLIKNKKIHTDKIIVFYWILLLIDFEIFLNNFSFDTRNINNIININIGTVCVAGD